MPFLFFGLCVGFSLCFGQAARAQTPSAPTAMSIEFRLATDVVPSGDIQLANGTVVDVADWSTLIMAQINVGTGGDGKQRVATCTATLVGPTVVLMAAHCVDNPLGAKPRAALLRVDGRKLALDCAIHPDYLKHDPRVSSPRGSEDWALCLVNDMGVPPATLASMKFDVVLATSPLALNEPVLMVGYGCSDLHVENGELAWSQSDKRLRIGDERISSPPIWGSLNPTYATIVSSKGLEPALCPGDSGGPLFSGIASDSPRQPRRIRAVNSSVAVSKRSDAGYDIVSMVAATGNSTFERWAKAWVNQHKLFKPVICGISRRPGESPCLQ